MLTINKNGHFESNGKVLKSLNQVLKASTDYYNDKDWTYLALSTGLIETVAVTDGDMKDLISKTFSDHDPILQTEAGIQELVKLGIKRRKQSDRRYDKKYSNK